MKKLIVDVGTDNIGTEVSAGDEQTSCNSVVLTSVTAHTITIYLLFIYYAKWRHKYIYGKIRKETHSYNTNLKTLKT